MRFKASFLILAALLVPSWVNAQTSATPEGRVIVRFKADADSVRAHRLDVRMSAAEADPIAQARAEGLARRRGMASLHMRSGRSLDERTQVVVASGIDSATLAKRLAQDSEVELVAVDHLRKHFATANDPYFGTTTMTSTIPASGQWYLQAPTSSVVSSINVPGAWDITFGSSSTYVAVIDTGVRKDHPDLASQFIGGYDFVAYTSSSAAALATANDGDRADSDASDPGDWVSQADITAGTLGSGCTSSDIGNSSWHGTHVSGLIAASTNNGIGMAGVAGGVRIVPVRVLGKCGGYDSDIIAGMKWAAGLSVTGVPANAYPAKVLNMSLGGTGSCAATDSTGALYRSAISSITATGATIVVAAGNGEGLAVGLPANCPGVIAVAALRHAGTKVGFSNIGPEVSISAPGGNCVNVDASGNTTGPCLYPILSASNTGTQGPVAATYDSGFGTSYSTPLVTGTVALMYSVKPTLTSTEVLRLLQTTSRAFATTGGSASTPQCRAPTTVVQDECYCTTATCGAGMLDATAAVTATQALNNGTVSISVSPASGATVGQTITLTASAALGTGRSVASWAWTLVDGGGAVPAFASGASSATATLAPTAAGVISVKATATDDLGLSYSMNSTITVSAAASSGNSGATSTGSGGSSGGGGGAFSPLWLLGLMLASWLLRRQRAQQA